MSIPPTPIEVRELAARMAVLADDLTALFARADAGSPTRLALTAVDHAASPTADHYVTICPGLIVSGEGELDIGGRDEDSRVRAHRAASGASVRRPDGVQRLRGSLLAVFRLRDNDLA
ncbi:hypothetical protein [Candidatus Frankia nodulisporulans]|uniref:hypothetical protein n=1 Tax=Candidatus Frankia nodulisporulans TaxID=2060052 RepID=UPI0013D3759D|nr:hypothetical protein [Candidatus Frankia nodulisporulans]